MLSSMSCLTALSCGLACQVVELKMKVDAVEKRETEKRQLEEKKHQEEISALKKTNQQLKVRPYITYTLLAIHTHTIMYFDLTYRPSSRGSSYRRNNF